MEYSRSVLANYGKSSNGRNLAAYLKKIPHLSLISRIAKKYDINIWLVGGFLRDAYLKKKKLLNDFDFCVEKNTFSMVREFSQKISSKFIVLDKTNESLRVILRKKNISYTYDFTLIRAKDFYLDVSLRDFSINTLAVNLKDKKTKLIDFFNAKGDLRHGIVRVLNEEVIPQDPLRILRGFSFMANYGFRIEARTLKLLAKYKSLIKKVSGERINEELFKILASAESFKVIMLMDKLKIIDEIIPEITKMRGVSQGAYHHLDVWKHSLEALRQFELFVRRVAVKNEEFSSYLNEELTFNRRRVQIIKLACILHDIGKPAAKKRLKKKTIFYIHEKIGRDLAEGISKKLRLSLREKEILKKLIFWHLRPGYLADQINPSKRAIYRFFRDTQDAGAAVIFLSLADWKATRGPLTDMAKRKKHERVMLGLVKKYFFDKKKKPIPSIIDGYDIMTKFHLTSSPLVGDILKKVKEEQALGKVSTKTGAYSIARIIITKLKKS
ncbi:MAG: HD domain-containing protein [Omnitrophica bacterium]|nr:HD domain-containing protein [Candidatus Omnitrophota bacterium]